MRTNITYILFLFTFVLMGNLQFTLGQLHTVNYTIPSWNNATGSFTFETGTTENPVTKKTEGYFKVISKDDKIIEITPQFINSFIQKINKSVVNSKSTNNLKISEEKTNAIEKLNRLKLLLEDEVRMNEIITKLQNGDVSGLNWDYTVQTIRTFQTQITGTVD